MRKKKKKIVAGAGGATRDTSEDETKDKQTISSFPQMAQGSYGYSKQQKPQASYAMFEATAQTKWSED